MPWYQRPHNMYLSYMLKCRYNQNVNEANCTCVPIEAFIKSSATCTKTHQTHYKNRWKTRNNSTGSIFWCRNDVIAYTKSKKWILVSLIKAKIPSSLTMSGFIVRSRWKAIVKVRVNVDSLQSSAYIQRKRKRQTTNDNMQVIYGCRIEVAGENSWAYRDRPRRKYLDGCSENHSFLCARCHKVPYLSLSILRNICISHVNKNTTARARINNHKTKKTKIPSARSTLTQNKWSFWC